MFYFISMFKKTKNLFILLIGKNKFILLNFKKRLIKNKNNKFKRFTKIKII